MEEKLKGFIAELKCLAQENETEFYIVGGYIRDKLLNSKAKLKDIDFVYTGDIYVLVEKLEAKGFRFYPVKEEEGIYGTVISDLHVDISKMKGDTIEEDLQKRDYTINAIALNLVQMKVIDIFKGRRAIESRILQEVNENSLEDDPIRILRGMRFYIKYGFHFSLHTEESVVKFAYMLKECKGERVFNELMNIIQCDKDGRAFELLDNYKILENIMPYICELKTIVKSKDHLEDTFTHMDLTYKIYKELLNGVLDINNIDISILNDKIGNFSLKEYIAFACFSHDIGKYVSYSEQGEKISFYNHERAGAEIIEQKCNELKFPKEALNIVVSVVGNHRIPLELFEIRKDSIFNKQLYEFFHVNNKYVPYIIITSFCDVYATKMIHDPLNEKNSFKEFIEELMILFKKYTNIINDKWIDGNYIIDNTNKLGEEIGRIINEVNELRFLGVIKNKSEAQEFIISNYKNVN
jgi:poly(A) polymerase